MKECCERKARCSQSRSQNVSVASEDVKTKYIETLRDRGSREDLNRRSETIEE